jgi:hypothetical protein
VVFLVSRNIKIFPSYLKKKAEENLLKISLGLRRSFPFGKKKKNLALLWGNGFNLFVKHI